MGYENGNWGATEWLAMGLMMLLFWALILGLALWAIRTFRQRSGETAAEPAAAGPRGLLAERYAPGEVDDEEFKRRRGLLAETASTDA